MIFKRSKKADPVVERSRASTTQVLATTRPAKTERKDAKPANPTDGRFARLRRKKAAVEKAPSARGESGRATDSVKARQPSTAKLNRPIKETLREPKEPWLLPALTRSLQRVFETAQKRTAREETRRTEIETAMLQNFTDRMENVFGELHKEFDERERVLDQKIKRTDQEHRHQVQRVRWLSVPAAIVAVIALGYVFYVVNVMENAMTSMSGNMSAMTGNLSSITQDTRSMSQDMGQLSGNVSQMTQNVGALSGNVGYMTRDVGAMSHAITPAAQSMGPMMGMVRNFMPF